MKNSHQLFQNGLLFHKAKHKSFKNTELNILFKIVSWIFKLEILGTCQPQMIKYFKCLAVSKNDSNKCIDEQKNFLRCRMDQ